MKELGIVLDFGRNMIMKDQIDLPMRSLKELQKPNIVYQMYKNIEPFSTTDMTKRAFHIFYAKCEKNRPACNVDTCYHLSTAENESLLQLLTKCDIRFSS